MHPSIHGTIAGAIVSAAIVGGGAAYYAKHPSTPTVVNVSGSPFASARSLDLAVATTWPELEQNEVDAITAALKARTGKEPVLILCRDDTRCGSLALNLDNAFESAKWESTIDTPILGGGSPGLQTNRTYIKEIIEQATGGRFAVSMLPPRRNVVTGVVVEPDKDPATLVIGRRKPAR